MRLVRMASAFGAKLVVEFPMDVRTFFSLAFLSPFLFGIIGLAVPQLKFFTLAITFGGVPYVFLVVAAICLIWTARVRARLVIVTLVAPVVFAVLEACYLALLTSNPVTRAQPVAESIGPLGFFSAIALVTGYTFVACAWGLWAVASRFDLVHRDLSP